MTNTELPELPYYGTCCYCGENGLIVYIDHRNELDIPVCESCRNYNPHE